MATAAQARGIAPEWARRMHVRVTLPDFPGPGAESEIFRTAVVAALFRKTCLPQLAQSGLVQAIARRAATAGSLRPVPSPMARRYPQEFGGQQSALHTPPDVEAWMQETIMLFHAPDEPDTSRRSARSEVFWWDALRPLAPGGAGMDAAGAAASDAPFATTSEESHP